MRPITECFRSRRGQIVDTQYRLVSPQNALTSRDRLDGTPAGEVTRSSRVEARTHHIVRGTQHWVGVGARRQTGGGDRFVALWRSAVV